MRAARGIAGAVLVTALLSGCNGEPSQAGPTASPTPSPPAESATPSPSPSERSPSPPPLPPQAKAHTDSAAIAFGHHYVDVLNYTAQSGDTALVRRLSASSCETCNNIIDVTEEIYGGGGHIDGGRWRVRSQSVFQPGPGPERIVTFHVNVSPQRYRTSQTEAFERSNAQRGIVSFYLRPRGESWIVTRMDRQA